MDIEGDSPIPRFLLILPRANVGFFSHFFQVLALLEIAERKGLIPVVFFNAKYPYWSQAGEPNAWDHYFAPLSNYTVSDITGRSEQELAHFTCHDFDTLRLPNVFVTNSYFPEKVGIYGIQSEEQRTLCASIVKKYIRVQPEILERVESFISTHFDQTTIGIHVRGSDKPTEYKLVTDVNVALTWDDFIQEANAIRKGGKVFVATESNEALQALLAGMPGSIYVNATRISGKTPPHLTRGRDGVQVGEEALVDCLLLSRTAHLIHGLSNLSAAALVFSPLLPHTDLFARAVSRCQGVVNSRGPLG